jgi:hypothetical protein
MASPALRTALAVLALGSNGLFACGFPEEAYPHAAVRVAHATDGWVQVTEDDWFSVDLPDEPSTNRATQTYDWGSVEEKQLTVRAGDERYELSYAEPSSLPNDERVLGDLRREFQDPPPWGQVLEQGPVALQGGKGMRVKLRLAPPSSCPTCSASIERLQLVVSRRRFISLLYRAPEPAFDERHAERFLQSFSLAPATTSDDVPQSRGMGSLNKRPPSSQTDSPDGAPGYAWTRP